MPKHILVADDDDKISFLVQLKLQEKGYSVMTARDGQEVLEMVKAARPDLLILDVCMPKMDGDQVYMTLHSQPQTRNLPILMLTALRSDEEIEEGHEENIFAKPVHFDRLFAKIKQILGE